MKRSAEIIKYRGRNRIGRAPVRRRRARPRRPYGIYGFVLLIAFGLPLLTALNSPDMLGRAGISVPAIVSSSPASRNAGLEVVWVDGDSGRIGGRAFRLHGVDAPEGSVSRARCSLERQRADRARSAARRLTAGQGVIVARTYGRDRYGRELVDLTLGGRDVAGMLMRDGHLKRWRYEAGAPKPDWCSGAKVL